MKPNSLPVSSCVNYYCNQDRTDLVLLTFLRYIRTPRAYIQGLMTYTDRSAQQLGFLLKK